jgi:hypothetical protein
MWLAGVWYRSGVWSVEERFLFPGSWDFFQMSLLIRGLLSLERYLRNAKFKALFIVEGIDWFG